MANNLQDILPKILARGLLALREQAIMPRLVNGDFSSEAAQKGATIDVPIPSAVGIQQVAPGVTPPAAVDTTVRTVPVSLNNWYQNDPIHLTDKDLVEIDRNRHFMPMQMSEAIRSLANQVNLSIHEKFKGLERGVFGFVGTPGVTPFGAGVGVKSATGARKNLHAQLAPRTSRRGVLNFDAEAQALELEAFSDAEKVGGATVKIEGEIGRKFGIDWVADDQVVTHTAGTISDGGGGRTAAIDNAGGYPAGTEIVNLDNGAAASLTGTITRGDIVSFAGHSQTYCVVDNTASGNFSAPDYTAAGNAISGLKLYPALKQSVADDEVMTVQNTHVVNMVFHRDAFAFATRPLQASTQDLQLGSQIMSLQDPQTGLVLRLEVSRQHKQVAWEFDILWGVELIRPELVTRIAG